jgi:hypothetical protein
LTPNDPYRGRTAPLTSKRCILYIYSRNIGTGYLKNGIYCPFFSSSKCSLFHNSNLFGSCIIHISYTGCANIKRNNSGIKYFKHGIYSPFFSSSKCSLFHNSNLFVSCIIHILYTGCAKIKKKNISGAKRLIFRFAITLHIPNSFPVTAAVDLTTFNHKELSFRGTVSSDVCYALLQANCRTHIEAAIL